jgi:hypothetical protein
VIFPCKTLENFANGKNMLQELSGGLLVHRLAAQRGQEVCDGDRSPYLLRFKKNSPPFHDRNCICVPLRASVKAVKLS